MEKRWQMTKEDEDKIKNALHKKLNNPQPLFTLTADEVEIVERNLVYFFKSDKEEVDKILTRIKQWQDENRTDN